MIKSRAQMTPQTPREPAPFAPPEIDTTTVTLPPSEHRPKRRLSRLSALLEVAMCSGYPTQLLIVAILTGLGVAVASDTGQLSLLWVVILSMADTVLLIALVLYFLRGTGDHPRAVFLGTRPIRPELRLGVYLIPVTFCVAFALLAVLHWVIPGLRNVPENPFEIFLRSPGSASVFAVVAVVAGGVREELQRAFILVRFEQSLGGAWVGLGVFSVAFGLGHYPQGWDAVIATGLLGAFWGVVYLIRRSVVSTILCHAGFNLTEILVALAASNASSA